MERTYEQTVHDLRMMLRDEPPNTTADITDAAVVYLLGNELKGILLSADEPDGLDEPFAVDAWFVGQVDENLKDWFAAPRFSRRPALSVWLLDASPIESGVK